MMFQLLSLCHLIRAEKNIIEFRLPFHFNLKALCMTHQRRVFCMVLINWQQFLYPLILHVGLLSYFKRLIKGQTCRQTSLDQLTSTAILQHEALNEELLWKKPPPDQRSFLCSSFVVLPNFLVIIQLWLRTPNHLVREVIRGMSTDIQTEVSAPNRLTTSLSHSSSSLWWCIKQST